MGLLGYIVPPLVGQPSHSGQERSPWLFLPVAGPWITLATCERCHDGTMSCANGIYDTVLVAGGVLQLTGLALMVAGAASRQDYLAIDKAPAGLSIKSVGLAGLGQGGLGLTVAGEL